MISSASFSRRSCSCSERLTVFILELDYQKFGQKYCKNYPFKGVRQKIYSDLHTKSLKVSSNRSSTLKNNKLMKKTYILALGLSIALLPAISQAQLKIPKIF